MNIKYLKHRTSISQPPIKRSQSAIHFSQFFSHHHHQFPINHPPIIDHQDKQNQNHNVQIKLKYITQKNQENYQITPKKKIIHLKSLSRNSKSQKGNSDSMSKKQNIAEQSFAEVADFTATTTQNTRPSLIIEIDLLQKYQRSIQDTLTSSVGQIEQAIHGQHQICTQHFNKKATFIVKGKPYCDKCAVGYITKGFLAVRLQKQKPSTQPIPPSSSQQPQYLYLDQKIKQQRNQHLNQFIDQLDKTQPMLQSISSKLNSYMHWLKQHFTCQIQNFQQNWNNLISLMQKWKQKIYQTFKTQQQKSYQTLQQQIIKVNQQTQSLRFMRNDIVCNIDKIMDQKTVPQQKFLQVITNFRSQLTQTTHNISSIKTNTLILSHPTFNFQKFTQDLNQCIIIKPILQTQLFMSNKTSPPHNKNILQLDLDDDNNNPYRLSFGKDNEKILSPTFKVI